MCNEVKMLLTQVGTKVSLTGKITWDTAVQHRHQSLLWYVLSQSFFVLMFKYFVLICPCEGHRDPMSSSVILSILCSLKMKTCLRKERSLKLWILKTPIRSVLPRWQRSWLLLFGFTLTIKRNRQRAILSTWTLTICFLWGGVPAMATQCNNQGKLRNPEGRQRQWMKSESLEIMSNNMNVCYIFQNS